MLKTLTLAGLTGLTALIAACAPVVPSADGDPVRTPVGSTASGESTAAGLGFHGPVYRGNKTDGPN